MSKFDDFIVEIGTEELPPKELVNLVNVFSKFLTSSLAEAGITFGEVKTFATPRRLAVLIENISSQQKEQLITKRGPSLTAAYSPDGSATKAALGFASSCGVGIQELTTQTTDKGAWLYFEKKVCGQKTISLLPTMVEKALAKLPIKRPMRWNTGEFSFVRPVHWILMLFGQEIVKANIFGVKSSNFTLGHRVHSPEQIIISAPNTYEQQLETAGKVIPDFFKRKKIILNSINDLATMDNGSAIVDPELLNMVTGLVEFPVALMANFNVEFLRIAKECLISSMQDHQKCFALIDKNNKLLPKFILISNIESTDPKSIIRGNELVMHARLADAAFYFDKDKQQTLESRVPRLKNIVYQKQLGSLYEKTIRIQQLSEYIAKSLNADINASKRAAYLSKADLLTSMVYEFPELQGIMGCYYAENDNETNIVASAIKDHYKPKFAQDSLPESQVGACVAIADRIDSLVGLFGINKIPTGEKDPYALRRQSLAVLRILIEKNINFDLQDLFIQAFENYQGKINDATPELLTFCFERLKAWYLSNGIEAKTFAAVMATSPTKPLDFHRRIQAVTGFKLLPEAENLAAANKRVHNLLEKSKQASSLNIRKELIETGAENELYVALENKELQLAEMIKNQDYTAILKSLSSLQVPIDNFFNNVMVMVEDTSLRENRLNLLQRLRNLFLQVADISLL